MTREQHHLTEDEMDEALMGTASFESAAHLQACAQCAESFADFNSTVANFNQASGAWSEAKSNALSRDLEQHQTPFRISSRVVWFCASALVLLFAVVLGFGVPPRAEQAAASRAEFRGAPSQGSSSEDALRSEIASDDAMLRQIDAAINKAETSPEDLYGRANTATTTRQSIRQARVGN